MCPSPWPRVLGPSTAVPLTRSPPCAPSVIAMACGCTSTAPTEPQLFSARSINRRSHPSPAPIALPWTPHKWLYIPVEAGLVLIRDGQAMRDTFSLVPPYLRNDGQTDEIF